MELTVQHPVHWNRDRPSTDFFGTSDRPQQQKLQQQSRRTNFVTALQLKQQQQQHSRLFNLPQKVSVVGGGMVGGAMPSAPIESDLAFFFRLPQQTQHENHRRGRTSVDATDFAATIAAAVAGRPFRFRPQHFPHSRGRRFQTAAQHFLERLSAATAEAVAVAVIEVGGRLPTVDRRRPLPPSPPPPHNFRANRL